MVAFPLPGPGAPPSDHGEFPPPVEDGETALDPLRLDLGEAAAPESRRLRMFS